MKKNKKKINFKKYLKFFYVIFSIVILISIFYFDRISYHLPSRYKFFFEKINDLIFGKVQVIEIKGNNLITKDEILFAIYKEEVSQDDTMVINSESKIRQNLMKNQIIKQVNIKRFLPNKMIIYVDEKSPILKFFDSEKNKFLTIDKAGNVIDFYSPNLIVPLIIGAFDITDLLKFYNKIQDFNIIQDNISDIYSFYGYKFNIVLNRKILVLLPETEQKESLKLLEKLITQNNILEKNIKQIDLRVKGKIFIKYFKKEEQNSFKISNEIVTFKSSY